MLSQAEFKESYLPSFGSVAPVHHHVAWLLAAIVVVSVVFGHEVCVVDGEAVEIVHLERFHEADVDDHALVEIKPRGLRKWSWKTVVEVAYGR